MKRILGLVVKTGTVGLLLTSSLGAEVCHGQTLPAGRYFGQTPPGLAPSVFAPGVISLPSRYEYCLVFSPSGEECVFGLTNASWGGFNLLYTRMSPDSSWSDPTPAPFQGEGDGVYPTFAPDGNAICFASSRPQYPPMRLHRTERVSGSWTEPEALEPPIFSGVNEWGSSFANDGTLYFCSDRSGAGDIYQAVTAPDGSVAVEVVGPPISTPQLEGAPFIAPDGSYLIFESRRPGGLGLSDLYISFREGGAWSTPRNLGAGINTAQNEDGPFVSPDGKYLFFNRRRAGFTTEPSEIWWVDARVVFDPSLSATEPEPAAQGRSLLRVAPNPLTGVGRLTYLVPSSGFVSIKIYDVLGREVRSLVDAPRAAGTYSTPLDLPPDDGRGVYFCRLQLDERLLASAKALSSR